MWSARGGRPFVVADSFLARTPRPRPKEVKTCEANERNEAWHLDLARDLEAVLPISVEDSEGGRRV